MFLAFGLDVAIAVKVVGNMAKFGGFGNGELGDFVLAKVLVECVFDVYRRNELMFGNMTVGLVFGKAGKIDIFWYNVSFEKGEIIESESLGNFEGAIGAKIKIDEGIMIVDLA